MQSPAVFDIDRLAAPISDDAPTGVDLRSADAAVYWEIKDARKKAREIEDALGKGAEADPKNPLDWGKVLHPGLRALEEKTKDLEIAAYVLEAALRVHGVPGLRDGFRLARKLVETFWEELYPPLELEDDPPNPEPRKSAATRVVTLGGVNSSSLIGPVERLLVARSARLGNFSYLQYKDAIDRKRDADLGQITQAAAETDAGYYRTLVADLKAAQEEFTRLTVALDERCGGESPPSTRMAGLLESLLESATRLAGDKLNEPAADGAGPGPALQPGAGAQPGKAGGADVLRTRDDAFHTLQRVAEYFRRTEPHSFVSYALEQVIRWGKTPLPELLAELIASEDSRRDLFKLVGIKPPEEKSNM
jgi:type VI secretion system protein ImpA